MSFSRSHRRPSSSSDRAKGDRNEIVGLSGWLFADLLLAVAVVFLIASVKPEFSSNPVPPVNDDGPPTVEISFGSEFGEVADGIPVWNEDAPIGDDNQIKIEVKFSERVIKFGESPEDVKNDILVEAKRDDKLVEGNETGWIVNELKNENTNGFTWSFMLVPTNARILGIINLKIVAGAVTDKNGNKNPESKILQFKAKGKVEKRIDTKNSSQITLVLPSSECSDNNREETSMKLMELILKSYFVADLASGKPIAGEGILGDYIEKTYGGTAQIGFVFMYGPGDDDSIARKWQPCVFSAFEKLNYLKSDVDLPFKTFKDATLSKGKLKIEMYFYSSSDNS